MKMKKHTITIEAVEDGFVAKYDVAPQGVHSSDMRVYGQRVFTDIAAVIAFAISFLRPNSLADFAWCKDSMDEDDLKALLEEVVDANWKAECDYRAWREECDKQVANGDA